MQELFDWLTGAGREVAVLVISMLPFVELRGAIPLGIAAGMAPWSAFAIACVGNILPIPLIILFEERLLDWMETLRPLAKLAVRYRAKLESKTEKITKYAWWGLCFFVSIPLPGTGAWTGAAIAAILHMPLRKSVPSIAFGVMIAGILVTLAMSGLLGVIRAF